MDARNRWLWCWLRLSLLCVAVWTSASAIGCGQESDAGATVAATHSESGLDGGALFERNCVQCHSESVEIGPPLRGVYGRRAASVPGFNYTQALRDSNIRWSRENLLLLMLKPQELVPGVNMVQSSLDREAAELVAKYLESL